ncbi:MAG: GHKL domain-containing protein [Gemmatimonadetes bacterium]|nr:MAG: GHKL domain-containing protein [Gemmatimonadota bacterium]
MTPTPNPLSKPRSEETFIFWLTLILIVGFGGYVLFSLVSNSNALMELNRQKALSLSNSLMSGIRTVMLSGEAEQAVELLRDIRRNVTHVENLRIYDRHGDEVYSDAIYNPTSTLPVTPALLDSVQRVLKTLQPVEFIKNNPTGTRYMTQLRPLRNEKSCQSADCHSSDHDVRAVVEVSTSLQQIDDKIRWNRNLALVVGLLVVLLSWILLKLMVASARQHVAELQEKLDVIEKQQEELKQSQAQVVENEKLATLGEMAAMITHEINNAITGINAPLYMIKNAKPLDEEKIWQCWESDQEGTALAEELARFRQEWQMIQEAADLITLADERTRTVISDVSNLIGGKSRKLGDVDLCQVFRETVRLQQRKLDNITLVEKFSADRVVIRGTSGEIGQIFMNLVINAVHALEGRPNPTITVEIKDEPDSVVVRFSDNGCGMPAEVQRRIFEPFYSTKGERGTGLGLSTVFRIVHKYNGNITVESEEGIGTTFILTLPRDSRESEQ